MAIGNETDMLHSLNMDFLVALLTEMRAADIRNPVILVTKAPLWEGGLERIRAVGNLQLVFFLSYSGLGRRHEPGFAEEQLQRNFAIAKAFGFPVVHFWRPLLPDNTTVAAVRAMLSFASSNADATVFIGLKLHRELTRVITANGEIEVPEELRDQTGEWLDRETIDLIYQEAQRICPTYPLYRHTSCALAYVLGRPNHTATVYREDICPPSHCPAAQRQMCLDARRIPTEQEIARVLRSLGRSITYTRHRDSISLESEVSQEEFAFLLHNLRCPLRAKRIRMQNLYRGSIYAGQRVTD